MQVFNYIDINEILSFQLKLSLIWENIRVKNLLDLKSYHRGELLLECSNS